VGLYTYITGAFVGTMNEHFNILPYSRARSKPHFINHQGDAYNRPIRCRIPTGHTHCQRQ